MRRARVLIAAVALAAVVVLPADSAVARFDVSAAAVCAKETQKLNKFKRGMKAAQRRFFRANRSKKARARFLKQQRRKLASLKKARRRCLANQSPGPSPGPPAPDPPSGGGPGPPGDPPATSAIDNVMSSSASFEPDELSVENGVEYVRTQLELELAPGATVPQMQALLDRLDAEVVSSLDGVGLLTVRIPDPGSLADARALVAGLAGAPGLAHADLATVPVTTELPDIQPADAGLLRPQLASGAHAMWNARAGLDGVPPTLLLADYFGAGPPGPEVAVAERAADFATGNPHAHGYTVLGLAAGTFESGAVANLQADRVAGMWAGPDLPLRVVDLRFRVAGSTMHDRILQLVGSLAGDVVVSTSVADGCAPAGCTVEEIHREALQWIQRVRGSGLEDRFLHVSAAGNIYTGLPTDISAWRGAAVNAAALIPLPGGVANLTNTIVVENTTASDPADGPIVPICLTATSKRGGHISAVGNDIKSLSAPGVPRDLPEGGTSSATPQVAGTAATVWALAPSLTPSGVAGILRGTARPVVDIGGDPRCGDAPAAPALDAYAATLAADGAATQPAREAILDGDGDGDFDELDLEEFRDAFVASVADGEVDLDYGRFDLNGDGYTGGGRDRFDLDASSPPAWSFSGRREVLGLEVLHNENDARDLDVLCHEANGPLYAGDTTARDTFNEQHCVPPVEIVADPAFPSTVQPGFANNLRIVARRTDLTDPTVRQQPGVRLEYTVTGGNVGAVTGVTGQDGSFSTTATLVSPADELEIEVVARAGAGGPELDRLTVVATRPSSGNVSIAMVRSSFSAYAEACAGRDGEGCTIENREQEGELATFGPFSGSGGATYTENGTPGFYDGNSATASANATQSSTIKAVAADPEVVANGSAGGSSQLTQGANASVWAAFQSQVGVFMRFTVSGGSVNYSAQGTLSSSGARCERHVRPIQNQRRLPIRASDPERERRGQRDAAPWHLRDGLVRELRPQQQLHHRQRHGVVLDHLRHRPLTDVQYRRLGGGRLQLHAHTVQGATQ